MTVRFGGDYVQVGGDDGSQLWLFRCVCVCRCVYPCLLVAMIERDQSNWLLFGQFNVQMWLIGCLLNNICSHTTLTCVRINATCGLWADGYDRTSEMQRMRVQRNVELK